MKTKELVKHFIFVSGLLFMGFLFFSCSSYAQNKKEKNKKEIMRIYIEKDADGKTVKFDTLISRDGSVDIEDELKSMKIDLPGFSFDIDVDESADTEKDVADNKKRKKERVIMSMSCNDIEGLEKLDEKIEKALKGMQIHCITDDENENVFFDFPFTSSSNAKVYNKVIKSDSEGNGKIRKRIIIDIDDDTDSSNDKAVKETEYVRIKVRISEPTEAEKKLVEKAGVNNKNLLALDDFHFAPNPGSKQFDISFSSQEKGRVEVKIFDINGKEIYSETAKDFPGIYRKSVDLSGKTSGVYLLVISQNGKSFCRKIAVQ